MIKSTKLAALLTELDDGDLLTPNAVGNLAIMRNDEYVGWIDLTDESVEWVNDDRLAD